jgi:peptide/nickel transport system permease protein
VLFFTIRRVLGSIVVLIASSFLVFLMTAFSFDPLAQFRQTQPMPPPEFFESKREQLGLNDPLFIRYFDWLTGAVTGDFGVNINNVPVADQLFGRLLVTGRLVIAAMILAVLLAIVVGVVSAVRQYTASDYVFTVFAYILIALPTFWFAALLKEFVAIGINDLAGERILFTLGDETPGISSYGTTSMIFWDRIGHLVLPTLSLGLLTFAAWSRFQRASMLDVLSADYMRLARAKGVPWRRVIVRHGLRNALIPLTTVVAIGVGGIFGGAIVTEQVFVWHGMGEYLIQDGIGNNDLNVVLGWLLVSAFFVIAFNLVADLLYAVLDPRIRLS